jgi:DeoR family fructose operon transcriptional repressor
VLASERQRRIHDLVLSRESVTSAELMELLGASESTIRRDLDQLERMNKISRVHGGAARVGDDYVLRDQALTEKNTLNVAQKRAIAAYATTLVKPGDFVYLDAGSTTEALADEITERDATYLTNSLPIARKLLARGCKTMLPGGTVKPLTEALVGEETIASLGKYHFTVGFWGTNGFTPETGFTTPEPSEAMVKEFAIGQTLTPYVLCDSSKFSKVSLVTCAAADAATIVCDCAPQEDAYARLANLVSLEAIHADNMPGPSGQL